MLIAYPRRARIASHIALVFFYGLSAAPIVVYFAEGGGAGVLPLFWWVLVLLYLFGLAIVTDVHRLTGVSVEVGRADKLVRFVEHGVVRSYSCDEVEHFVRAHKGEPVQIWLIEKGSARRLALYSRDCPGFPELVAWSREHLMVRPGFTTLRLLVASLAGEADRRSEGSQGWRSLVVPVMATTAAGAALIAVNLAAASGEQRTFSSMGPTIWWRSGWPFPTLFDPCHPHFPRFEEAAIWRGALLENLLYALGILALVWLAFRRRPGRRIGVKFLSIHLLTAVIVLAGVATLDLVWRFPPFFLDPDLDRHFWPFRGFPFGTAYVMQWRARGGLSTAGLVLNLSIWVPALVTLAILCEWLIPRRAPGARGRRAAALVGGLAAVWLVAAATFVLVHRRKAIFRAVESGDLDETTSLLRGDPGLARRVHEPTGSTPLHVAVRRGHAHLLLPLLQSGADPDVPNLSGDTAVHLAADEARPAVMKVLLENGADPNAADKSVMAPLDLAAEHPGKVHAPATLWLLPGKGEEAWRPPLYVAANPYRGDDALATGRLLLQHGAEPNLRAKTTGETALTRVIGDPLGRDRPEIVEAMVSLLLDHGADPNLRTDYGGTALHRAARGGSLRLCRALVAKGADVNAVDEEHDTPLHGAAEWGGVAVVGFLIENGADVSAGDEKGDTPLHRACRQGKAEVVRLLVAAGADADAANADGKTPADLARDPGVVEALSVGGGEGTERDGNGGGDGE
ncbi:MAG: ankyrin repeat domain-containing protein [Planctomycetota bacterium]|jgi:ankyrin repeat protein